MKARIAATVVAIAMIAVGLLIRSRGDDDNGSGGDEPAEAGGEVVCAVELADLCDGLDGARIEAVGDTVERLVAGDDLPAAWVTFDPYPALVDLLRDNAGVDGTFGEARTVGATGLAAVVRDGRDRALAEACGGTITWTCLGDMAGDRWESLGASASWGSVKPGHDGLDGGRGPLSLAAGISAVIGGDGWSRAELESGPGATWLRSVERAQPSFSATADSALEQLLVLPASYDLVLTTTDQAERLVTATGRSGFVVAYPAPVRSVTVVVAGTGASATAGRLGELAGSTPSDASPLDIDPGALSALITLAGQL